AAARSARSSAVSAATSWGTHVPALAFRWFREGRTAYRKLPRRCSWDPKTCLPPHNRVRRRPSRLLWRWKLLLECGTMLQGLMLMRMGSDSNGTGSNDREFVDSKLNKLPRALFPRHRGIAFQRPRADRRLAQDGLTRRQYPGSFSPPPSTGVECSHKDTQ